MGFRNFRERVETLPQRDARISQAFYYKQLPSTQNDASGRGKFGAPSGTLIVADSQTEGRGRKNRPWESPSGKGLYFSLLLRPALAAARAPLLTLAAGLGIGRTLRELGMEELIIKWPNDLTVGKKKLGGILTEMVHQKEKVDFVVIGVGLNVETEAADLSPETAPLATSLKQVQDRTWDKGEILERVLGALLDEVQRLVDRGPAELVGRWEQESGMVGHRIRVLRENGDVEGTVLGLRDDGQLKIETAEGGLLHLLAEDTVLCS